ncbi:unnamed protein product [marine sediment metagenome]|uniref:Histidine kinase/HSP90-like ATPase domain-containing protein n=1 Tax=marine sediment metagenome TaxID=412755 RepID=X1Q7U9_9ZZZZ
MSQNGMNNYTAEDIQILDEIEAVRLRPGMYIGGTGHEGLQRLLYEIVYNSIDEAMAGKDLSFLSMLIARSTISIISYLEIEGIFDAILIFASV